MEQWACGKGSSMKSPMVILGVNDLENDIDIYMQPLFVELKVL